MKPKQQIITGNENPFAEPIRVRIPQGRRLPLAPCDKEYGGIGTAIPSAKETPEWSKAKNRSKGE